MTFKSKSAPDNSLDVNTFIFSISPLQLTLALTLLITGCTLGPDFKSPESPDTDS